MKHLFTCTRCQLEARLQGQIRSLQQARRGFTASSPGYQTFQTQELPRQLPLHDKVGRYSLGTQTSSDPSRGRYSRKTLEPEQLLDEIENPLGQRGRSGPSQANIPNGPRGGRYDHGEERGPALPRELFKKVDPFARSVRGLKQSDDTKLVAVLGESAWTRLQELAADPSISEASIPLGDYPVFAGAYFGYLGYVCKTYLGNSLEALGSRRLPTPSSMLTLADTFKIDVTDLWAETTWKFADRLVQLRTGSMSTKQQRSATLKQLMALWNRAVFKKLRRSALPHSDADRQLDWSFLPNAEIMLQDARNALDEGRKLSFAAVINMLVVRPQRNQNVRTLRYYDYPSAALVTLDALHMHMQHGANELEFEENRASSYEPFQNFLEYVLKNVDTPGLPKAFDTNVRFSRPYREVAARLELFNPDKVVSWRPAEALGTKTTNGNIENHVRPERRSVAGKHDNGLSEDFTLSTQSEDPAAMMESDTSTQVPAEGEGSLTNELDRFVNVRISRLGMALQRHDIQLAERVKREVFTMSTTDSGSKLPNKLYEHVMYTLLTMRQLQPALETWNHFIQIGRQPTAQTYTVMMRGAQYARDVTAMEAFWRKMRDAGIQPDAHAWSTRIFGLIKGNQTEAGMKALDELSREWVTAAKAKLAAGRPKSQSRKMGAVDAPLAESLQDIDGDVDGVPKPSLVIMNAAISALASKNDRLVPKVLGWGRQFGLQPDRTTYNTLLNVVMRTGNTEEAIRLLRRMGELGIEADSTTWTILISSLFQGRALDELRPEEQQQRIVDYVRGLESAASSGIDQKGYALIIDRMLKTYNNPAAATAVLTHMISKEVQPSPHIYTILMASYFQRQPVPDFAAAETLWTQIQASDEGRGATLDSIFYDRMIEAYAVHHHVVGIEPMLHFLERMSKERRRPSWRALEAAARALAERGDWNRLLQIVDDARNWLRDGEGEMMVDERKYGQRDFWEFIVSTGLLREEGIDRPEQLRRMPTGQSPMIRRMTETGR